MFWFNKNDPRAVYMDNRDMEAILCDGRTLNVHPDVIADFRDMPFEDNTFSLVVFDPPHLLHIGDGAYMALKYGRLGERWTDDIKKGFDECMRVLKPNGTLIVKWSDNQISVTDLIGVLGEKPLFGNRMSKTGHWLVYIKEGVRP
jgi:SAM-dependent methyltransferase